MESRRFKTMILALALIYALLPMTIACNTHRGANVASKDELVKLPIPRTKSDVSVEAALASRRSIRSYKSDALDLEVLGQILWSAQGITETSKKYRTAPSAGATFPLEMYVLVDNVSGIKAGIYRYYPEEHSIKLSHAGDFKTPIREKAARQGSITQAPFTLIFCADMDRIRPRYKDRSERYVFMEIGHAAQNVHLQCETLNLGTVCIGAFDDIALHEVLKLPKEHIPYNMMPIGMK